MACVCGALLGCAPEATSLDAAADVRPILSGAPMLPTRDVALEQVVGVGDTKSLFRDVDDGSSAASADDDLTYVRGSAATLHSAHTVGFSNGPSGAVNEVTVVYRASRGSAAGTAQAFLYDGTKLLGAGKVNALGAWAQFSDSFVGLAVSSANTLQVKLVLLNQAGVGALRYTQLWIQVVAGGACAPTTCAAQGKTCGSIPDGCGALLACGSCTAPATCGGGGVPNVCSGSSDPVIVAAGDIACGPNGRVTTGLSCKQQQTSDLLVGRGYRAVLLLGDNQYEAGAATDYAQFFGPTWGRFKALIHPVPGNHEYGTAKAAGYFQYFGAPAGDPAKGYYSYNLGAWHLIALNTNTPGTNPADPLDCGAVSCKAGSAQEQWLKADLAQNTARCTLAYWHHPRFSSGDHGNNPVSAALWAALYQAKVDVVLNGHDHNYERLAPVDPAGNADPLNGIREFVVGTGGVDFRGLHPPLPVSEARQSSTFGVLELTLHANSYDWAFVPMAGQTWTDHGTGACH